MINKRKVVLVGTGFVGMSAAYSLINQGGVNEMVLVDVLKDKAEGEAMDLAHGLACVPNRVDIKSGDYDECADADVVVITAGMPQKPGQTRLELLKVNAKIMAEITRNCVAAGFNGVFVVATNPCDLMTYVVSEVSKFPKERVIGSGTALDSARLRYMVGTRLGVSPKNVHAYVLGEHGDSSFIPWSHAYIGCKSLKEILEDKGESEEFYDDVCNDVRQAAYEIINRKKATYYGVGLALAKIVKVILNNEDEVMAVSAYMNGNYGHKGMFIGVPVILGNEGVKEIIDIRLTDEEKKKFDESYAILESMKSEIDNIINE